MCRGAKPLLGEDIYRLQDEEDTLCNTGSISLASGPLRDSRSVTALENIKNLSSLP